MPGPVFRPSIVGVKETMKEMEYLVTHKGVKYCKIYPPGEKWNMNDERYFPVYALAQEMGLTIAFHTGHGLIYGANTEACNPRHLEEVCRNFYDLKILAFHFGWPCASIAWTTPMRSHTNTVLPATTGAVSLAVDSETCHFVSMSLGMATRV